MSPDRWQQVEAALDAVLDAEPSERTSILHQMCQGDPALRDEVEHLLAAHDAAGTFLEGPANEFAAPLLADATTDTLEYPAARTAPTVDTREKTRPSSTAEAPEHDVRRTSPPPPGESSASTSRAYPRVLLALGGLLVAALATWGVTSYLSAPSEASHAEMLLKELPPLFGESTARDLQARNVLTPRASITEHPSFSESDRARLASARSSLALSLGRFALADSASREALLTWQRLEPAGGPSLAAALALRANLAQRLSDANSAEQRYREALAMRRAALPKDHPDIATNLNDLGVVLQRRDSAEASTLLTEALRLRRKHYGETHPYVANTLNNMAVLHHEAGALDKAERLYREARAIYERTAGTDHPRAVTLSANLAVLLHDRGAHEQAHALYLRVIEQCRQLYGQRHPQLGRVLYNLATLEHERDQFEEAEDHYRTALAVLEETLPPEHPQSQRVRTAYARLLQATRRTREAAALLPDGQ